LTLLQERKEFFQLGVGTWAPPELHRHPFAGIGGIVQDEYAGLHAAGHSEPNQNRCTGRPFATIRHIGHLPVPWLYGASADTPLVLLAYESVAETMA